jgi:hypothetical protein
MFMMILLILIIIFLLYFIYKSTKKNELYNPPIDFVYTWVDINKLYDLNGGDKANYVDNNELLFSLRSIEKYANFYNKIYIIVHDDQLPSWIYLKNPKLVIISHSQFIPFQYLPTFNSLSIESFIHYIPNLSEHYLYFNDDMIILNELKPSLLFDNNNNPIESKCTSINKELKLNKYNNIIDIPQLKYKFNNLIQFNDQILDHYFKIENRFQSQHIPSPNKKSEHIKMDNFLSKILFKNNISLLEFTRKSQYRESNSIARYSLFKKYWNIYKLNSKIQVFPILYIEINHLNSKKTEIEKIGNTKDIFLCIQNNIAYGDKNDKIGIYDYKLLNNKLKELFPNPSSFEISYYH